MKRGLCALAAALLFGLCAPGVAQEALTVDVSAEAMPLETAKQLTALLGRAVEPAQVELIAEEETDDTLRALVRRDEAPQLAICSPEEARLDAKEGMLAALAGILWTGRFAGGRYSLGETSGTDVIAATVLGGASMAGGKASIVGAVFGSVLIGMLNNALVMYGLDTHQQMMVSGLVIILAVAVTVKREPLK